MSAIDSCRTVVIFLRASPTRFVIQTKTGSSASANSVSRQSRMNIATTLAITVVTLPTIEVAVERDDLLHAADVVRDPRLHVAGAGAGEEGQREPLQVLVDRRAQVVHHALADLVREQRLHDAERAGGDCDRDHAGDEQVQQREIAGCVARQRVVEGRLDEECRDRAERGREEDQREDGREPELVGPEQADDPAEVRAADGRVRGALDRFGRLERA